jgi:DNA-binding NtrC family response regulator
MKYRLLIAEDDQDMRNLLADIARETGFDVRVASDGQQANDLLHSMAPDVLLTDLRLPPPNGLALLRIARALEPQMPVVLITGFATVDDAVEGFKNGLYDLITKPFNTAHLRALILRLLDHLRHRDRSAQLSAQLSTQVALAGSGPDELVTESRAAKQVAKLAREIAPLDIPVLIQGETGSGKGVLARAIHDFGPRGGNLFFALNCAAISPTLVESELFGHEKGAFTGAGERKRGLLELADGGTLLLDEINSTPPEVQARLLQFIQERRFVRVGGERIVSVDVRLLVATNEDLARLVEQGRFRRDLFYRLNVFPIVLPPLRERREDIAVLAERFIARYARQYARPARLLTGEALAALNRYDWPGNIRELENIVQRAMVLAPGEAIGSEHLPAELMQRPASATELVHVPPNATLAELETYWIDITLARCQGNKTEAARRLGIDITTLHRRLKKGA